MSKRFDVGRFIARCMLDADPLVQYRPSPAANRPHTPALAKLYTRAKEATAFGKKYRIVTYNDGPIELYRVEPDGQQVFIGYARDLLRNLNRGIAR
jgi:hypothetical protein